MVVAVWLWLYGFGFVAVVLSCRKSTSDLVGRLEGWLSLLLFGLSCLGCGVWTLDFGVWVLVLGFVALALWLWLCGFNVVVVALSLPPPIRGKAAVLSAGRCRTNRFLATRPKQPDPTSQELSGISRPASSSSCISFCTNTLYMSGDFKA